MAFIPKTILLDKGTPGHFEAYDILSQRSGGVTADNMVKQYIVQNVNHEFVQYLFSASDEDGYNIYGFVVKVPYDIDTDKIAELTTPLLDVTERGPSLREEQIEKNRIEVEARKESFKNLMEIKSMSDKHELDYKKLPKVKDRYIHPEYNEYYKKEDEIAQKYQEAKDHYENTKSTNLGGTKRRKRRTKRTKKRR
jgi:hypothetical protein